MAILGGLAIKLVIAVALGIAGAFGAHEYNKHVARDEPPATVSGSDVLLWTVASYALIEFVRRPRRADDGDTDTTGT